jgi:hypothetical protein
MTTYNLRKNCKVYIVQGTAKYELPVYPNLNFSQTYEERPVKTKNLHEDYAMFEGAVINKANPANFDFTVMLGRAQDFRVICSWMTLVQQYDIYIDTGLKVFKIAGAVIERGTFQFTFLPTVSLSGTGTKLSEVSAVPSATSFVPVNDTAITHSLRVVLGGSTLERLTALSVDFVNEITWVEYDTIHKSLYVTNASDMQYPEDFVVSGRSVYGTIQQNLTAASSSDGWSTNSSLLIVLGDYFGINLPSIVSTVNTAVGDVFTQSITFRLNMNSMFFFVPQTSATLISFDFVLDSYAITTITQDVGNVFLFSNPGVNVALDFTGNQYDLR